MSRFEENLWESVLDTHAEDLADTRVAPPRRSALGRPRLLAGATAATAAAGAAALTVALGVTSTSPAFAVTRQHDGTVLVELNRASAIGTVNDRLAAMGVPAYLVAAAPGSAPPCPRGARAEPTASPQPRTAAPVRLTTTSGTLSPAPAPRRQPRPLIRPLEPARGALTVLLPAPARPRSDRARLLRPVPATSSTTGRGRGRSRPLIRPIPAAARVEPRPRLDRLSALAPRVLHVVACVARDR